MMATISTIHDLYQAVAKHLTGRTSIKLRWRHPAIREFDGTCFRKNDTYTIDINPGLSDYDKLYAFCHECGHVRSHGTKLTSRYVDYPPASLSLTDWEVKNSRNDAKTTGTIEAMANYWGGIWMTYSDKRYQRWMDYYGMNEEEARLRSLLEWTG